ncbi:hypothetical protein L9F63_009954, partial [Diploptera punctata]
MKALLIIIFALTAMLAAECPDNCTLQIITDCPIVECAEGYKPAACLTDPYGCCPGCALIEDMKIIVILLLSGVVCFDGDPTTCNADKCDHIECPAIKCAPGYITYPVNYPCVCCPSCIPILNKGDACSLPVTTATCDEGLDCIEGVCTQNITTIQ